MKQPVRELLQTEGDTETQGFSDRGSQNDKVCDQFAVQQPSVRASRRKDDFIFYDKTSDTFVKPNLWLMVNPNIACPIQYGLNPECEHSEEIQTPLLLTGGTHTPLPPPAMLTSHDAPLYNLVSPPPQHKVRNEDISCQPAKSRRKARTTKTRDSKILMKAGGWPRPPVNYCILIALALKSSHSGSLKVQQIYNFTREYFPFFQTAPDGWKNTIRHNLCFNSSFRKTCNLLCRDGKRKSCFWHLTLDGHRRLTDELRALTGESLKQLEKSMSRPGEHVLST